MYSNDPSTAIVAEVIAKRSGVNADDLWVAVASHTAMMVAEMALDLRRSSTDPRPTPEYAEAVISVLTASGAVVPRLPSITAG